jgi:hypothetical protein
MELKRKRETTKYMQFKYVTICVFRAYHMSIQDKL